MQILRLHRKGNHLNTLERFYIYKEPSSTNHLNDDHTIPNNQIFKTILSNFLEENQ